VLLNRNNRSVETQSAARHHESSAETEVALSRDLRMFDITMIGVGAMIGAGIFVLTGIAAGEAGPALVLAFLLNGVVTSLTAMAYAELGSIYPGAGGGYLWVREALGGEVGFLSGWMSWFASSVAGSLYALAFGRFATELVAMMGLPIPEIAVLGHAAADFLPLVFMTLIVIAFTTINYMGASEAGAVGNVITLTKIAILAVLVVFGLITMSRHPDWQLRYTQDFAPYGVSGILVAMGLTFIAFEGYEIIAQSGEEVVDPRRTIPRATFLSIGIAVVIYVLVAFTAIGAIQVPPGSGLTPYEYLGQKGEIAIVEAAEQFFPFGTGALILLVAGLASTMSALNATTYSSSRVSFAMGRAHNLPPFFGQIHPRRHTPYWAVIISGVLIAGAAWALPLDTVAAAASIMYLLLFVQVNISAMVLRRRAPEETGAFRIPWFPLVPVLGLLTQAALAVYLFTFRPAAWYTALGWIFVGLLAYYIYFSRKEEMEKPREILLEEVLVSRDYSVMVPIASQQQARILGKIGSIIARDQGGEVLALHVARVPPQLTLADGRYFLREARPYLDAVIEQARQLDVPVHTMIRLGRDVADAIRRTALEDASDLIVLGWPGYTGTVGRLFGSVIDPVIDNPPVDMVLVRYRKERPLRSILVPVSSGPNSRRAVKLAISMAHQEETPSQVHVIKVIPPNAPDSLRVRARQTIATSLEGVGVHKHLSTALVEGERVTDAILQTAEDYDLIVMGASEEPLFRNLLTGSIPAQVARSARVTVMIVKRRSGLIHSVLRQTVLAPSTGAGANGHQPPEREALVDALPPAQEG
jgi:amino acid transporter/nucleotide-binding universal stress UspA family protein